MKKNANELDELVTAASMRFRALVGELLDAGVRPETISTAMAQELTSSIAAIAVMKKGKTPEERREFVFRFFEILANIARQNCEDLEAKKEDDHEAN